MYMCVLCNLKRLLYTHTIHTHIYIYKVGLMVSIFFKPAISVFYIWIYIFIYPCISLRYLMIILEYLYIHISQVDWRLQDLPEAVVLWSQFLFLKPVPHGNVLFLQAITQLPHHIVDTALCLIQGPYEEIPYLWHQVCETEKAVGFSILWNIII